MPSPTCPKCGPRNDEDLEALAPRDAYLTQLKSWRTWAVAFGVTALTGMICGALHLSTAGMGAGSGVLIAGYMGTDRKSTRLNSSHRL